MGWGRPKDIRHKLERLWQRGELLDERAAEKRFPLALPLRKPDSRDLADDFEGVRRWIGELEAGSRETRGFGYDIEWQEIRHRVHGRNRRPARVFIPSREDALRLIGKQSDARRYEACVERTGQRVPALRHWVQAHPIRVLEHAEYWERILSVVDWFIAHPRPGIYRRALEIPDVDTKFIEAHRGILADLLDQALPDEAIDTQASGVRGFDRRYGLKEEPTLVRLRILDPAIAIRGLTDLTVPVEEFARLDLDIDRVFITENKINGLAFPDHPRSIVIMGLGYGIERLARADWLQEATVRYWGDIDTHGFAILNRLRHHFPAAQSLLMDRATLLQHRPLWTREQANQRFDGILDRLTQPETDLYDDLRNDRLGERVRLEQERIGFDWVRSVLS